jgi:hypothetical protein
MRTKELELEGRYTVKLRGREVVVIVERIDTTPNLGHRAKIHGRVEGTGELVVLRSPSQFLAHLSPS